VTAVGQGRLDWSGTFGFHDKWERLGLLLAGLVLHSQQLSFWQKHIIHGSYPWWLAVWQPLEW
jgi:hypothetical protein